MRINSKLSLLMAGISACAASVANSGQPVNTTEFPSDTAAGQLSLGEYMAANSGAGASTSSAAVQTFLNSSIDYLLPTLGENVPDYLKRVEFEVQVQENLKPEYSILTVQPLYQTPDRDKTVFTQLSQRRYTYLGTDRDVTNVGFGYRQTFYDNTVLAGVNAFFDYEWRREHKRAGVGGEIKWSGVDFAANLYHGLGGASSSGLSAGTSEEVLDGRDVELSAQVPYLPWAKVHGRKYYWDTSASSEDIDGWSASFEADLQQNLKVEAGVIKDNLMSERENFAKIAFHIPLGTPRPVAMSSEFVSHTAWNMRDMRDYALDKVRRENKIIVERTGAGVVITRGN